MFRTVRMMWRALTAAIIVIGALYLSTVGDAETAFTPAQIEAIEGVIESYLVEHPEVIERATTRLEAKRQEAEEAAQRDAILTSRMELYDDLGSHSTGNPNGDVTIVEFFDYRCGYCKRVFPTVLALLDQDPNLRLVLKEFPILGPESEYASRFAMAARKLDPDKYVPLHNALMESRGGLNRATVFQIATEVGLIPEVVETGINAPDISATIRANYQLAERLGIGGTPAFVIGDQMVPGAISLERFAEIIDETRRNCITC